MTVVDQIALLDLRQRLNMIEETLGTLGSAVIPCYIATEKPCHEKDLLFWLRFLTTHHRLWVPAPEHLFHLTYNNYTIQWCRLCEKELPLRELPLEPLEHHDSWWVIPAQGVIKPCRMCRKETSLRCERCLSSYCSKSCMLRQKKMYGKNAGCHDACERLRNTELECKNTQAYYGVTTYRTSRNANDIIAYGDFPTRQHMKRHQPVCRLFFQKGSTFTLHLEIFGTLDDSNQPRGWIRCKIPAFRLEDVRLEEKDYRTFYWKSS